MDQVISELVLNLFPVVIRMIEGMKANEDRCKQIADRVRALEELVLTIKQRGPGQNSDTVERALKELCTILNYAKDLMSKFSQTKGVKRFLMSGSIEEKFSEVNQRLMENFTILSGALQIEQNNILHKMYETVSGQTPKPVGVIPSYPMPLPTPVSNPTNLMPVTYVPLMPTPFVAQPVYYSTTTSRIVISNNLGPRPAIRTVSQVQLAGIANTMSVIRAVTPMNFGLY